MRGRAQRGGRRPGGSWRCRLHSWRVTQHRRNLDPRKKAQLLRGLLGWAQRHGFREEGSGCSVRAGTRRFTEADAQLWAERLGAPFTPAVEPGVAPKAAGEARGRRPPPYGERPAATSCGRDPAGRRAALALMLDWENIKVSLAQHLDERPEAGVTALRPRLDRRRARLTPAQRGLAARPPPTAVGGRGLGPGLFEGDQKAARNARFSTDIAGRDKADA